MILAKVHNIEIFSATLKKKTRVRSSICWREIKKSQLQLYSVPISISVKYKIRSPWLLELSSSFSSLCSSMEKLTHLTPLSTT